MYKTLTDKQKSAICFGFNHDLRNKINANWNITKPEIGDDFYTDKQRTLIDQVVRGITSKDGYKTIIHQMNDDAGGMHSYSIAIFGEPGSSEFEFELTGRHLTLRADGNSVDKAAFAKFFHTCLDNGVYFAPSPYETGFISVAHSTEDIATTVAVAEQALMAI